MKFTVNGESHTVHTAPTVATLVDDLVGSREGVAVAVAGHVVPASVWQDTRINDGDEIDVLTAVQGG